MDLLEQLRASIGPSYSVERELAQGGMATVFLAEDRKHGRKVALKVLRPELAVCIASHRFLREIEIVANLSHPHILPLLDSGSAGDLPYYVMPYIPGQSLRDRLAREGPLPVADALWLSWEVADALNYAHAAGVIHRDIKPENILVSGHHAVVADFGIAKAVDAAGKGDATSAGILLGSLGYMSPEQATGDTELGPQTDIFSLGVVLYEILTGVLPFSGRTPVESIASRILETPRSARSLREDVPEWLDAVVLRAMARLPAERFASAKELADALQPATGARPLPAPPRRLSAALAGAAADTGAPSPSSTIRTPSSYPRSIAVLPFASMSPDPGDEHFSDGITEEIINVLSRLPGLRVAARTSSFAFKGKPVDIRTVGERLNVRTALEGSVRRAGNRIRITAQLINALDGHHIWSQRYDRELRDVFAIQDEIAATIAGELKVKLLDAEGPGPRRPTDNLEAYELYLKGRHFWSERGLASVRQALAYFGAAVERDPAYALAYAGIADCYFVLTNWSYLAPRIGYENAKAAALRSIELDETLAEGHVSLASVRFGYDWDWPEAEREFRRATALSPGLALAHYAFAASLAAHGRFDEAVAEANEACQLDPLNRQVASVLGRVYYLARRYDAAVAAMQKSLDLPPDIASTHMWLALSLLEVGRGAEALLEASKALELAPSSPVFIALKGYVGGRLGNSSFVEEALSKLRAQSVSAAFYLGEMSLALGNVEEALEWLRTSIDEREDGLVTYGLAPIFDCVRSHERFRELMGKVGISH